MTVYPETIAKEELAKRIDISLESGFYANNLGKLRTLGAIDKPRWGYMRAQEVLFPVAVAAKAQCSFP